MHKFTDISPKHSLEIFDKLITPILTYGGEIWGFSKPVQQERVHLQFCKKLLGIKRSSQNDFVYGELGRAPLQNKVFFSVVNFWFKILEAEENKYVTRHDTLCPNAVERDVGKTRRKSDVIFANALCCAICTSLSVSC